MSSKRSLLLRLLFAVLFVLGQQQAIAHALDHDFERIHSSSQDGTGHDELCAKCLVVAHLDHADSGSAPPISAVSYAPPRCAAALRDSASPAFFAAYRSRAPPTFS